MISWIFIAVSFFSISPCFSQQHIHIKPTNANQVASTIPGYGPVVIDPQRLQMLGVTTEKVIFKDLTKTIRTVGIVEVDETRIAHIQTKFTGWIEQLYVNFIGMPVALGQPLFSVYSQELLATQEEYLLALKDMERPMKGRFAKEFNQSSQNLLHAAQQRLTLWDVPSDEICRLQKTRTATRTLAIRSSVDGIVLDKTAFIGMNVGPGIRTYTIADLSHLWVLADLYENDISLVQLGQKGTLSMSSLPNKKFTGTVTFIDYVVATPTRTAKVRFELENKNMLLKPGMYATAEINIPMGPALALPEEAVIDTGKRKLVFISLGQGRFEPREVTLGFKAGPYYQVLSGVSEGEVVITSAQFLFDSESRLQSLGKVKGLGIS